MGGGHGCPAPKTEHRLALNSKGRSATPPLVSGVHTPPAGTDSEDEVHQLRAPPRASPPAPACFSPASGVLGLEVNILGLKYPQRDQRLIIREEEVAPHWPDPSGRASEQTDFPMPSIVSTNVVVWTETKCHGLGTSKEQTCISHSPGGWKSEIRAPAWLGEDPPLGFTLVTQSSHRGGARSSQCLLEGR